MATPIKMESPHAMTEVIANNAQEGHQEIAVKQENASPQIKQASESESEIKDLSFDHALADLLSSHMDFKYDDSNDEFFNMPFDEFLQTSMNLEPYAPRDEIQTTTVSGNEGLLLNNQVILNQAMGVVTPPKDPAAIVLKFKSASEANAYTPQKWTIPVVDSTVPQTQEAREEVVRQLIAAMYCLTESRDNEGMLKPWREGRYNLQRVEIACWNILNSCIDRHETGPLRCLWDAKDNGRGDGITSFEERIGIILQILRERKTICKRLIDVPFFFNFIDDPGYQANRVEQNKGLNAKKGVVIRAGKDALEKEEKATGKTLITGIRKRSKINAPMSPSTAAQRLTKRGQKHSPRTMASIQAYIHHSGHLSCPHTSYQASASTVNTNCGHVHNTATSFVTPSMLMNHGIHASAPQYNPAISQEHQELGLQASANMIPNMGFQPASNCPLMETQFCGGPNPEFAHLESNIPQFYPMNIHNAFTSGFAPAMHGPNMTQMPVDQYVHNNYGYQPSPESLPEH